MQKRKWFVGLAGFSALVMVAIPADLGAQGQAPPPARQIPGITAEDAFPAACVSCHVVLPDGMDVRLSTLMGQWVEGVDSLLLTVAQSSAPAGVTLVGRHPEVSAALTDIPGACLACHLRSAGAAPPFARLLHKLHLAGGEQSIFLSVFQGECTHCHKLDLTSGAWSIPSGPEP